jgi:hypothetical protein
MMRKVGRVPKRGSFDSLQDLDDKVIGSLDDYNAKEARPYCRTQPASPGQRNCLALWRARHSWWARRRPDTRSWIPPVSPPPSMAPNYVVTLAYYVPTPWSIAY